MARQQAATGRETRVLRSLKSCRVYTPKALADGMVGAIAGPDLDWLDPCVGEGAFTSALARAGCNRSQVTGLDLNDKAHSSDGHATIARGIDFLTWARGCGRTFDRIIANPPFIPIGRLPLKLMKAALRVEVDKDHRIPKGANYWCAFLCQAVALLRKGGEISFLLPASWEYADYANRIRHELPGQFESFEVHRSGSPMFATVQEGSVVIVGRGYGLQHKRSSRFEYFDIKELIAGLSASGRKSSSSVMAVANRDRETLIELRDVLGIRLGGVTGDAGYFLLTDRQRLELGLPVRAVKPVVTRARDLRAAYLDEAAWETLRWSGARVWLFRPGKGTVNSAAVRAYLELSLGSGGCRREAEKVRTREPWYVTLMPRRPDGFLSGMSRLGPWICLRRKDDLNATNTLYTVHFHHRLGEAQKAAWCLAILSTQARRGAEGLGRRYPDGLLKYEPGDLASMLVPVPEKTTGAVGAYREAVESLLAERWSDAMSIADEWLVEQRGGKKARHSTRATG